MNSALYGKTYRIPEHIRQKVQSILYGVTENNNMGVRRAKFIVNNGTATYQMLKRLKNFFDYVDPVKNKAEYELAGGSDMKGFVDRTLNSERRLSSEKKKTNVMFMPQVSNRTLTPNSGRVDLSINENEELEHDYPFESGIAVIFSRGNGTDKLLLLKRPPEDSWQPNKYGFAGGKLEEGESPEEGTKREIYEEAGLTIDEFIGGFNFGYDKKYLVHCYIAIVEGEPNVQLSDEHVAYGWFSSDEVKNLPTTPHLDDIVALAKQKLIIWLVDNEETME